MFLVAAFTGCQTGLVPMLPAPQRRERDALCAALMLSGQTYARIAERVGLSLAGVHGAVRRGLAAGAERREDLADQAAATYIERLEALWEASHDDAMEGDVRAAEVCRKLPDQFAAVHGLARGRGPVEPPGPVVEGELTSLEAWRASRPRRPS